MCFVGAIEKGIVAFALVSATALVGRAQTVCRTPIDCPSNRVCVDGRCDFPPVQDESALTVTSFEREGRRRASEEVAVRKAEPIPTEPTPYDVGVNAAFHRGGRSDTERKPSGTPLTYLRNSLSVRGTVGYRLLSTSWSSLFVTAELGIMSYRTEWMGEWSGGTGDKDAGVVAFAPVLRIPLKKNLERWGLIPSDRTAIEVSAGGYVVFGAEPEGELGLIVRAELQFAWFRVGGGFTYGSTTEFQPMFVWGLRFGF